MFHKDYQRKTELRHTLRNGLIGAPRRRPFQVQKGENRSFLDRYSGKGANNVGQENVRLTDEQCEKGIFSDKKALKLDKLGFIDYYWYNISKERRHKILRQMGG